MQTDYQEQYIKFGLKVQYYRKLKGLTQEAFADEIGKSWSFVAKIESPNLFDTVLLKSSFATTYFLLGGHMLTLQMQDIKA